MYCVFGFSSCVDFQQVSGPPFSVFTVSPFLPRSDIEFSDAGETPSLTYQPICVFFLQMEEFVFAATRHVLVIVGGVLLEVRAACMMRRMPPKTSDE